MDEKEHQPDFGSHPSHSSIDEEETATAHGGEEREESQTIGKEEKLSSSSSTNFEPIRPGGGRPASRQASRRLSADTIETLRRERSNNGWGCDDIEADAAGGSVAPYNRTSNPCSFFPFRGPRGFVCLPLPPEPLSPTSPRCPD
jgi:hypothetical protein